jgi:hypothetical protein
MGGTFCPFSTTKKGHGASFPAGTAHFPIRKTLTDNQQTFLNRAQGSAISTGESDDNGPIAQEKSYSALRGHERGRKKTKGARGGGAFLRLANWQAEIPSYLMITRHQPSREPMALSGYIADIPLMTRRRTSGKS